MLALLVAAEPQRHIISRSSRSPWSPTSEETTGEEDIRSGFEIVYASDIMLDIFIRSTSGALAQQELLFLLGMLSHGVDAVVGKRFPAAGCSLRHAPPRAIHAPRIAHAAGAQHGTN